MPHSPQMHCRMFLNRSRCVQRACTAKSYAPMHNPFHQIVAHHLQGIVNLAPQQDASDYVEIIPKPGYVIKASTVDHVKVFINVFAASAIPAPATWDEAQVCVRFASLCTWSTDDTTRSSPSPFTIISYHHPSSPRSHWLLQRHYSNVPPPTP